MSEGEMIQHFESERKKDLEESEGEMIQNFESKTEGEDNEDENTRQGPGRMQVRWGLGRVKVKKGPGFLCQAK